MEMGYGHSPEFSPDSNKGKENIFGEKAEPVTEEAVAALLESRIDRISNPEAKQKIRYELEGINLGTKVLLEGLLSNMAEEQFSPDTLREQAEVAKEMIAEDWNITDKEMNPRIKQHMASLGEKAGHFLRHLAEQTGVEPQTIEEVFPEDE